jgi:hypothetical protein
MPFDAGFCSFKNAGTMLDQKIFHSFSTSSAGSLSKLYYSLFLAQEKDWPRFTEGVEALNDVHVRTLLCDGYMVQLQWNPRRIQSTAAHVDAQSIRERNCFLCIAHLPQEQQGILYRNEFLLLCNPAPIFRHHGTVSHIHHLPQEIEHSLIHLLDLAKDLTPHFTLFYNGPQCGASAPDHLHFQAVPAGRIPIEQESLDSGRMEELKTVGRVQLSTLKNYGRAILVMESEDRNELSSLFSNFASVLKTVLVSTQEPPLNLICSYKSNRWRLFVIPRTKHRPEIYFKEGEEKILISPASVDIGGLLITPLEKDFHRVTAEMVQNIFKEVTLEQSVFSRILERI